MNGPIPKRYRISLIKVPVQYRPNTVPVYHDDTVYA